MRSGLYKIVSLLELSVLIICFTTLVFSISGSAASLSQVELTTPQPSSIEGNIISNDVCLSCHGQPGMTKTLVHEDVLDLYVSPELYSASIHGSQGYACVQCHTNYMEIPHRIRNFADLRDVSLRLTDETCGRCHAGEVSNVENSVHAIAQAKGRREAAVCSDCHNPHTSPPLKDSDTGDLTAEARLQIPQTCAQCHYAIYERYQDSVHGASLINNNNQDVPTCIDCHGVHNIPDPTTTAFRLASPQLCAKCHTDPELMANYGLSTQVLSTYVADFHGTTVTLFDQQSPDTETNKPVCYDCHGVHDIARATDPEKGLRVKENLLSRCQECHPDATANFPTAWLSHYIPNPEKTPIVYYVSLFYKFFIPGVLGSMAILVAMDLRKLLYKRYKKTRQPQPIEERKPGESVLAPPPPTEAEFLQAVPELAPLEQTDQSEIPETGDVTIENEGCEKIESPEVTSLSDSQENSSNTVEKANLEHQDNDEPPTDDSNSDAEVKYD